MFFSKFEILIRNYIESVFPRISARPPPIHVGITHKNKRGQSSIMYLKNIPGVCQMFSRCIRFLHMTAKIRIVMGSCFHQTFLLISSTTVCFGVFGHLRNFSNILQKMAGKLQNSIFMGEKGGSSRQK